MAFMSFNATIKMEPHVENPSSKVKEELNTQRPRILSPSVLKTVTGTLAPDARIMGSGAAKAKSPKALQGKTPQNDCILFPQLVGKEETVEGKVIDTKPVKVTKRVTRMTMSSEEGMMSDDPNDLDYRGPGDRVNLMGRRRRHKKQKGFGHKPLKCPYCWKTSTMAFNWKPHAKRIHKIHDDIVAKIYEDMRDGKCPPTIDQLEVEMGVELPRFPMERPQRHTAYIQYQLATQKGPNGEPSLADQANLEAYRRTVNIGDAPRAINFTTRKRGRPRMEDTHALPTRRSQRQRRSANQNDTYVWENPSPSNSTGSAVSADPVVKDEPVDDMSVSTASFSAMPTLQSEDAPLLTSEADTAMDKAEDSFLKLPEPQSGTVTIAEGVKSQLMETDSNLANAEDSAMQKIRLLENALQLERSRLKMIRDKRLVSLMGLIGQTSRPHSG